MKYRLVLYDSNKNFKSVLILDSYEAVKEKIKSIKNGFYEVYKCNDRGNNYSRRNVTLDFI